MSVFGFCNNKCKHEVYTKDEITALLLNIKPIGSIEINTTGINPSEYIGGEWEAWGSGRVPVGVDATQEEFNTVEKTGGEKEHTLTVSEMPSHEHEIAYDQGSGGGTEWLSSGGNSGGAFWSSDFCKSRGGNAPHNNLQPYITCYMWKRIA